MDTLIGSLRKYAGERHTWARGQCVGIRVFLRGGPEGVVLRSD